MIKDEIGRALHQKASEGGNLTNYEKQQLEDWYSQQDKLELAIYQQSGIDKPVPGLEGQVEVALTQLIKLTDRIKQVSLENDRLRKENAQLLKQFTQRFGQQPA